MKHKTKTQIASFLTWLEMKIKKAEKHFECRFMDTKKIAQQVKFFNTIFLN